MQNILNSVQIIETELAKIREALATTEAKSTSQIASETKARPKSAKLFASSMSASELGPVPDIDDTWPIAIDQKMIVSADSDADKQFRALQIVNLIKIPMKGKVVLDCGCGEGHNASEMANVALKVVGYDVKKHDRWSSINKNNLVFVNGKQSASEHGPYDLIILYDVIDHIINEDPTDLIKHCASLLAKDGRIFIRTHPWASRTGGHYYESMNKAFIHLALTPDEAVKMGIKIKEPNLKVVRPMAAYEQWFKDSGLEIAEKRVKTSEVEPYFNGPIMDRIVKINWGGSVDNDTARKILSNHFIDYVLKKVD